MVAGFLGCIAGANFSGRVQVKYRQKREEMWKDILFILVAMVAGVTIYHYLSIASGPVATRNDDPRTPLPVLVQKDADAFSPGPGITGPLALSPGPAALADKAAPYALLNPPEAYRAPSGVSSIYAQACYKINPDNKHMLSSYSQEVNNYMRKYPDNCTTPFQELGFAIYRPAQIVQTPVDQLA